MVASNEPIYDSINKIKACLCVFWGTKAIFDYLMQFGIE